MNEYSIPYIPIHAPPYCTCAEGRDAGADDPVAVGVLGWPAPVAEGGCASVAGGGLFLLEPFPMIFGGPQGLGEGLGFRKIQAKIRPVENGS